MSVQEYTIKRLGHTAVIFKDKQPRLGHLDIELTERCNNACMHCYINLPENDITAKQRELTTEQWKDVLQQAADMGALSVRFTGGEPLLREDFTELYLFARRLGMKVILFTNARLITPELADLFTRIPPLKKIEISVYGMQEDSYDTITHRHGAYNEFRIGLNLLIERQIPFTLKFVVLPANKHEIERYESWIKTLTGNQKPNFTLTLNLRGRRDSRARNCQINDLRLSSGEVLSQMSRKGADFRLEMAQFSEKFMYPQGDELFNCGAGDSGCVDAYGRYQLCMLLRHPDMDYDLTNGTLREGLLEVFPRLRQAKASNPEYLRRCACCFLKSLCEQCPAKSWMEHGTLDTPVEYLCRVAHTQARFLGLLKEGEYSWEIRDWQERINRLIEKEKNRSGSPEKKGPFTEREL